MLFHCLCAQIDTALWSSNLAQYIEGNSSREWIKLKSGNELPTSLFTNLLTDALGLSSNHSLLLLKQSIDPLGFSHDKYQQFYNGIKVEGCEYILHTLNGVVNSSNGNVVRNLNANTTPSITEANALALALSHLNANLYGWQSYIVDDEDSVPVTQYPVGELLIAQISNVAELESSNYALTYRFEIMTIEPHFTSFAIYIDAITGGVCKAVNISRHAACTCCAGTTTTLHHGTRGITTKELHHGLPWRTFLLRDVCRGNVIQARYYGQAVKDPNNNFVNHYSDRAAASAFWAVEKSMDFFQHRYSRNGFDDNGADVIIEAGSADHTDNAEYNPINNNLYFGNFEEYASSDVVSLDVVGHEFTHGVTKYSAGLVSSGESGILDESFSDIFGTMIEYYGLYGDGDYLIGEDFVIAGAWRDMQNPNLRGDPDTYLGSFWITDELDFQFSHKNSGVQNYWFYLLAEGGSGVNDNGTDYDVTGIGRNSAAAIAYRNLTVYLTSTSNYADARNGSIWAAIDLFPICSNEVTQTINAWNAVGVGSATGQGYNINVDCNQLNFIRGQGQPYSSRAINALSSSCAISTNSAASVSFVAGKSISLSPGFSSAPNFLAYIEPCLTASEMAIIPPSSTGNDFYSETDRVLEYTLPVEEISVVLNSIPEFVMRPNPATAIVWFEHQDGLEQISLYDATGRCVLLHSSTNLTMVSLSIALLDPASYLVQAVDGKGAIHKRRLIKQ